MIYRQVFSKFTVNSVVLISLTVFSVVVAAIFNNPLLVYTAVFLVVTNIALFIWAQLSVTGIEIKRRHPRLAVATRPLEIIIELINQRRTPRYGILGFDLHNELTPGQEYTPVAFLDAPPGRTVASAYSMVPSRRGVFRIGPFYLYGGDPFGFYKCWRQREEYSELTVLPHPVSFRFVRSPSASMLKQDEMETVPVGGDSTEFLGVREYIEGEPLKRIHWRTSARLGKLISRQYELNVAAAVSALVLVDEAMLSGGKVDNPLEYSLSMVASLGHATLSERFHLSYLALLGSLHDTASGTGRSFYEELAIHLAQLSGHGPVDWENHGRVILNYLPAGSSLIVFTAKLDDAAKERLRHLSVHFRGLAVVVFDLESFEHRRSPANPEPRLSVELGYLVFKVHYGDDLAQVLGQVCGTPQLLGRRQ